jgi:hypothetical protein
MATPGTVGLIRRHGDEGEPVMTPPGPREAAGTSSDGEGRRWSEALGEEGAPGHGMSLRLDGKDEEAEGILARGKNGQWRHQVGRSVKQKWRRRR